MRDSALFFFRHGNYDPQHPDKPLTRLGEKRSEKLGREISKKLREYDINKVLIRHSPKLRMVQTVRLINRSVGARPTQEDFALDEYYEERLVQLNLHRAKVLVTTHEKIVLAGQAIGFGMHEEGLRHISEHYRIPERVVDQNLAEHELQPAEAWFIYLPTMQVYLLNPL